MTATGELLGQYLARDPHGMLGDEAVLGRRTTALLVKWIDAEDNLSLQIHPEDEYAQLGPDEAGKTEAWYVVDHEPNAGVYLGFQPGVGEREVREALAADADLSTLMAFWPMQRGDFVLLEPGTPHALGRGIAIIEPQAVAPNKRAVTYRYWDFRRRYDARGHLDSGGKPRELHIAHALAVTRWDRVSDPGWLASRIHRFGWPGADAATQASCEVLCAGDQGNRDRMYSSRLRVARLCGSGRSSLPSWNVLRAVTVVEGHVALGSGAGAMSVRAGETVAVPASSGALAVELQAAHAVVSACAG